MSLPDTTLTPTGRPVRTVTEADLAAVTSTLDVAFFDDPVLCWWIPEDHRRRDILPAFFRLIVEVHFPLGAIYGSDEMNATAVWVPPGRQPTADEMAALVPLFAEATEEYADRLFATLERMDALHPTEAHWYLFFLGTVPQWQSRGLGSALMRAVLEACDRDSIPAYLEATSERNKQLYLRHGFEVTGEMPLGDGVSLWPMWRAPAKDPS